MSVRIERARALAYRVRAVELDRDPAVGDHGDPVGLGPLDVGIQDTPPGSARLSLATRLGAGADPLADVGVGLAWSMRASPHVHRAADLSRVADALWPLTDRDAVNRLVTGGRGLASSDLASLDGFAVAVAGMAEVVTGPMTKGEASALLTEHLPDELSGFCEPCGSVHVYEMVFRSAALPAGIGLVAGTRPLTLAPIPDWPGSSPDRGATADLLRSFFARLGPATAAEAAAFVGSTRTEVEVDDVWPDGLVEVTVDGRPAWFTEDELDELLAADPADLTGLVRLLAPGDPLLKGGDRELLVPDPAHRKQLFRVLNNPGALLVGVEIGGSWKAKQSGRRLALTVTPFSKLTAATRRAVDRQAELVAAVRGAGSVTVAYDG